MWYVAGKEGFRLRGANSVRMVWTHKQREAVDRRTLLYRDEEPTQGEPTQTNRDYVRGYQETIRDYWAKFGLIGLGRLPLGRLFIPC